VTAELTHERRRRLLIVHQSDSSCLSRFRAERIDRLDSTNEAAKIGTAAHRACEAIANEAGDDGDPTREEMMTVARATIDATAAELAMTENGRAEAVSIMERATAPTSRVRILRPTGWNSSVELRWALDADWNPIAPDAPGAICGGMIDVVWWKDGESKVIVRDFKTTKKFQKPDDAADDWQARMYALWAIVNFGVREVRFEYVNLRHGYTVGATLRRDEPWFESTKARILALRAEREVALEMDVFAETMGDDCDYCPVRHRCGAIAQAAREGRTFDPNLSIADAARRLMALRAIEADYERRVKSHLDATGEPIDLGNGAAFGQKPVAKLRLVSRFAADDGSISPAQREALMVFLRGYGMSPEVEAAEFLFCREGDVPAAVKRVVHELLGREASRFLDDPNISPLEPVTRFEMSAWLPTTGKPKKLTDEQLDAQIDEAFA